MDPSRGDSLKQQSDAELVRLLVAGNHDAMAVIFDRYYRLIMNVALRILHDPGEAEDIVQIVFVDFYRKAKLFDAAKGSLRTWLLQYAYGRSFNQKKKRLRSGSFFEEVELEEMEADRHNGHTRLLFDVDRQDAARLVEQILPRLSEKQRIVIQLAFFGGMKLSEVASQTGQSLGNIHHAYYRGMDKLRGLLAGAGNHAAAESSSRKARTPWLRKARKTPPQLTGEVEIVKTRTF
jgi:RNA polymerase sigma-70 factor, ECF subfamily